MKSAYRIPELAALAGLSRFVTYSMLCKYGIAFADASALTSLGDPRVRRSLVVPTSELESKMPLLFRSLLAAEEIRGVVSGGRF